jgi:hypothetical protein
MSQDGSADNCRRWSFTSVELSHPAVALARLSDHGVLALRAVLPGALAAALCEHVDAELAAALTSPEAQACRLADINGSAARRDLLLTASAPLVLKALLTVTTAVLPLFEAWGCGCSVEEISCLVVDPGARAQEVHPDTPYDDEQDAVSLCKYRYRAVRVHLCI